MDEGNHLGMLRRIIIQNSFLSRTYLASVNRDVRPSAWTNKKRGSKTRGLHSSRATMSGSIFPTLPARGPVALALTTDWYRDRYVTGLEGPVARRSKYQLAPDKVEIAARLDRDRLGPLHFIQVEGPAPLSFGDMQFEDLLCVR